MASTGPHSPPGSHKEEDDEWEYEYSAIETETYYLTLDLSVRDFLDKMDENVQHSTRAGYRVWFNSSSRPDDAEDELGGNDRWGRAKPSDGNANDYDDEDEDNDPLSEAVRHRRIRMEAPEVVGVDKQPEASTERRPETIQIMELHGANPLVSYRGMIFCGSWAENVGTEMIFTRHEPHSGLQVLRHLPDDVDLLAASGARINFKEVKLEMHGQQKRQGQGEQHWEEVAAERYKQNGGVYIHVGSDKHGYRRPQASFLEDLAVLKQRRGEADAVTVTTVETNSNDLFHDDFDEMQRRKKVKKDRARNRNLAELAAAGKRGARAPRRGRGARRTGRAKGRGPPRGPSRANRTRLVEAGPPEQPPQYDRTPSGWDELETVSGHDALACEDISLSSKRDGRE